MPRGRGSNPRWPRGTPGGLGGQWMPTGYPDEALDLLVGVAKLLDDSSSGDRARRARYRSYVRAANTAASSGTDSHTLDRMRRVIGDAILSNFSAGDRRRLGTAFGAQVIDAAQREGARIRERAGVPARSPRGGIRNLRAMRDDNFRTLVTQMARSEDRAARNAVLTELERRHALRPDDWQAALNEMRAPGLTTRPPSRRSGPRRRSATGTGTTRAFDPEVHGRGGTAEIQPGDRLVRGDDSLEFVGWTPTGRLQFRSDSRRGARTPSYTPNSPVLRGRDLVRGDGTARRPDVGVSAPTPAAPRPTRTEDAEDGPPSYPTPPARLPYGEMDDARYVFLNGPGVAIESEVREWAWGTGAAGPDRVRVWASENVLIAQRDDTGERAEVTVFGENVVQTTTDIVARAVARRAGIVYGPPGTRAQEPLSAEDLRDRLVDWDGDGSFYVPGRWDVEVKWHPTRRYSVWVRGLEQVYGLDVTQAALRATLSQRRGPTNPPAIVEVPDDAPQVDEPEPPTPIPHTYPSTSRELAENVISQLPERLRSQARAVHRSTYSRIEAPIGGGRYDTIAYVRFRPRGRTGSPRHQISFVHGSDEALGAALRPPGPGQPFRARPDGAAHRMFNPDEHGYWGAAQVLENAINSARPGRRRPRPAQGTRAPRSRGSDPPLPGMAGRATANGRGQLLPPDPDSRAFGIEDEIAGVTHGNARAALRRAGLPVDNRSNYSATNFAAFLATQDISIGGNPEIKFPPLRGNDEGFELARRGIEALRDAGGRAGAQATHGLHVHIDARDLNLRERREAVKTYENNRDLIEQFVATNRRRAEYATPGVQDQHGTREINLGVKWGGLGTTVEFRRFGSNLNADDVISWAQLMKAIIDYYARERRSLPRQRSLDALFDALNIPEATREKLMARAQRIASGEGRQVGEPVRDRRVNA